MSDNVSANKVTCNELVVDKIILNGWEITVSGETILAKSPAGVETKFEMIDYKKILGEQPTTPPDYVAPTLSTTTQGYNESGTPANVSSTA